MNYEQLLDFVQNRMKVSHVYQPVYHLALLRGSGRSSIKETNRSILLHDESKVE
jgi:ATP adenylyltransferase